MRTNRIPAHTVLEGRVLRQALSLPQTAANPARALRSTVLKRPIFIVAAPRSGSTLLFETLAASEQLSTLGGEAHWLIESIPELRLGAPGVDSNRLGAAQANDAIAAGILEQIERHLQDARWESVTLTDRVRFLEKTPKNSLRIPFFNSIFPDALFVFLWRDPRENVSSIMEAWRSGHWKTYNGLDGFGGPWSLLLPPGWKTMNDKPLEEVAAFQWDVTNRIILDDLASLPPRRWMHLSYAEFIATPEDSIRRTCQFAQLNFDAALQARASLPLPLSRFTHTPPAPDKWRRNEAAILRVLPSVHFTWQRLQALR